MKKELLIFLFLVVLVLLSNSVLAVVLLGALVVYPFRKKLSLVPLILIVFSSALLMEIYPRHTIVNDFLNGASAGAFLLLIGKIFNKIGKKRNEKKS